MPKIAPKTPFGGISGQQEEEYTDVQRKAKDMAFLVRNPNPKTARVGDCVVRAISIVTGKDWEEVYAGLCVTGFELCDMPSSNAVWAAYLESLGFKKRVIECKGCYTVRDFANDHPEGKYILGTGTHAVAIIDGDYIDTWDSGDEVPIYYFQEEQS